jgi:hypothetical protein
MGGRFYGEALKFFHDVVLKYEGDECLAWPFYRINGYGRVYIDGVCHTVSRLVCELANGPPPSPGMDAAHSCGNGHLGCSTKRHLRWATRKENIADALAMGTASIGSKRPLAKLNEEDTKTIRKLSGKFKQKELADMFGVSNQVISGVITGKIWRHTL